MPKERFVNFETPFLCVLSSLIFCPYKEKEVLDPYVPPIC